MEEYMTTTWNDLAELEENKLEEKNLLLIDANNVAFRYLHRPNYDSFSDDYIRTISSLGKSYSSIRTICCFDVGASLFRKTIFPQYKQNRKVERSEPFEHYKFKGIEADDIITYLTLHLKQKYDNVWIVSSDRDLYQLLDDNVHIFNLFSRKEMTLDILEEQFELSPSQYLDSRIIEGDKSDNIFGIEGIGQKRSQSLIKEYGDLQTLVEALPLKGRAKYIKNLNEGLETLKLNQTLMDLCNNVERAISMSENPEVVTEVLESALTKGKSK